jgi:uncharacterized protein (TIGR03067 family)
MTRLAMFCGLVLVIGTATAQDKKEVPKELVPFQGTWKVVTATFAGETIPDSEKERLRFTFAGDKVTVKEGKKDDTGSYSVDPKKDPAEINLVGPKGEKIPGIYKFDKDGKLTITFSKGKDATRPKKFDDKEAVMMVLEKTKE